jgi:hypothetical protein
VTAHELLATPDAMLTRGRLAELGLGRRQIDSVFRELPVIALPNTRRPMVRVQDYLELIARSTFADDRVRSTKTSPTSSSVGNRLAVSPAAGGRSSG